ncbi:MAG TPA: hypothetical protein VL993_13625 [Stellaceae bacterium]|nr:hypothetical protein [Stellaceae bacterium]
MRAQYTRLFTDQHGKSRLEDVDIELSAGFAAPPAEPLHFAQFLVPDSTFWLGAPTDWKGDAMHPAPRRAIFVLVRGGFQVKTSDGAVRRFQAGNVLIVEDTTGDGHATAITGDEDGIVFAVGLPPSSAG